ncbi:MAG: DNA gyrase subunit A [Synergistales bacterium]|nr:DNA gyrase subunit A [Synergistales bacterium]
MTDSTGGPRDFGRVIPLPLEEEIKNSYLDYAMSVIVGRALPDARDGLKPVQRRILYAMLGLGLRHNQGYKKSARVVGETMGKYHPHGDSAIYDTMARMAQDFSMRYPHVDGQGNFGSIDGDPPAAMRYTEARLTALGEEMLQDIDEDTVDWGPNFDDSLQEPLTLPCRLPNLLINGSSGIAVGMATNIPPHNLGEVADALCYILDRKEDEEAELGEVMRFLHGPDFPTGGQILGREGIIDAYRTGRGKVVMRGRTTIEDLPRGKQAIIINEIPYLLNKTTFIETIAKNVQTKQLEGITDVRDESDRNGLRIVLEISRDHNAQLTLRQLYSRTQLQSTFGVINLALVNGQPRVMPLLEMLSIFLDYRREVVRRRTEFRLQKAEARAHIVEGLLKALDVIDEIVALIRASRDTDAARAGLIERFDFSEKQAQSILDMRLQRLTGLERQKLEEEYEQLIRQIEYYRSVLGDPQILDGVIKEELLDVRRRFGNERRTEIVDEIGDYSSEDLIPEKDLVVVLSRDSYLRRMPLEDYRCQGKGGKGVKGATPKGEDEIAFVTVGSTHRNVLLFTSRGRIFAIRGHMIPHPKAGKGKHVSRFIALEEGERVVAIRDSRLAGARYVFFLTKQGIAKRMPADELERITRAGRRILTLAPGDEIARVRCSGGGEDLLFVTAAGKALRVSEEEFRPLGRQARGVRGIRLAEGDHVVGCDIVRPGRTLLLLSRRGLGKRVRYDDFTPRHRGGQGVRAMNAGARTGEVIASWGVAENDSVMVISSRGRMVRCNASEIRLLGRQATGVIAVRLDDGDSVADMGVIRCDTEEEE